MTAASVRIGVASALTLLSFPSRGQLVDPYQFMGSINVKSCPTAQCIISFPPVPKTKRLVLTSISAQLGAGLKSFVLEGSNVIYYVPRSDPDSGVVSLPITLYYGPGTTPSARFFVPDKTQNASLSVTLVGHFVPS